MRGITPLTGVCLWTTFVILGVSLTGVSSQRGSSWDSCRGVVCNEVQRQAEGLTRLKLLRNYVVQTMQLMDSLVTSLDEELVKTGQGLSLFVGPHCETAHTLLQHITTINVSADTFNAAKVREDLDTSESRWPPTQSSQVDLSQHHEDVWPNVIEASSDGGGSGFSGVDDSQYVVPSYPGGQGKGSGGSGSDGSGGAFGGGHSGSGGSSGGFGGGHAGSAGSSSGFGGSHSGSAGSSSGFGGGHAGSAGSSGGFGGSHSGSTGSSGGFGGGHTGSAGSSGGFGGGHAGSAGSSGSFGGGHTGSTSSSGGFGGSHSGSAGSSGGFGGSHTGSAVSTGGFGGSHTGSAGSSGGFGGGLAGSAGSRGQGHGSGESGGKGKGPWAGGKKPGGGKDFAGAGCRGVDKGTPHWVPGLDEWCRINCAAGFCPAEKCVC
ncbi:uncharacterized protein LOC135201067 [Macrobrachium nipponense]|uniref:uncharacterized protein LOC135201067 n=1 Tax=Macrobrachium nipponense TaxID=159736 RepID=UPI0030C88C8D